MNVFGIDQGELIHRGGAGQDEEYEEGHDMYNEGLGHFCMACAVLRSTTFRFSYSYILAEPS